MLKYLANYITSLRIIVSLLLFTIEPFSYLFWLFYFFSGISDMADGLIARKMHQESNLGAKLDSIADLIFMFAITFIIIKTYTLPFWFWCLFIMVAILRFCAYAIGFYKFRTFTSMHTYLNKAAGCLLFLTPIFLQFTGFYFTVTIIGAITFISALEELLIIIKITQLKPDISGYGML